MTLKENIEEAQKEFDTKFPHSIYRHRKFDDVIMLNVAVLEEVLPHIRTFLREKLEHIAKEASETFISTLERLDDRAGRSASVDNVSRSWLQYEIRDIIRTQEEAKNKFLGT